MKQVAERCGGFVWKAAAANLGNLVMQAPQHQLGMPPKHLTVAFASIKSTCSPGPLCMLATFVKTEMPHGILHLAVFFESHWRLFDTPTLTQGDSRHCGYPETGAGKLSRQVGGSFPARVDRLQGGLYKQQTGGALLTSSSRTASLSTFRCQPKMQWVALRKSNVAWPKAGSLQENTAAGRTAENVKDAVGGVEDTKSGVAKGGLPAGSTAAERTAANLSQLAGGKQL